MKLNLILLSVVIFTCTLTAFGATLKKNSDEEEKNKEVSSTENKDKLVSFSVPIIIEKSSKKPSKTKNSSTKQITRGALAKGNSKLPKPKPKKQASLMSRILPMMIIPFMLQTAIIPMMLTMLKMSLLKAAFIGKMAIIVGLINMFRISTNPGGVYTHNVNVDKGGYMPKQLAQSHYGYNGDEEYGAYVNRRR